jgi:predicted transposase/invertase (TIGR01784 family)
MTKEEHDEYLYYKNHVDVDLDTLYTAERIGLEKGMARGRKEGIEQGQFKEKIEIAKNMIKIGVDINIISNVTQLSIDQIKKLT